MEQRPPQPPAIGERLPPVEERIIRAARPLDLDPFAAVDGAELIPLSMHKIAIGTDGDRVIFGIESEHELPVRMDAVYGQALALAQGFISASLKADREDALAMQRVMALDISARSFPEADHAGVVSHFLFLHDDSTRLISAYLRVCSEEDGRPITFVLTLSAPEAMALGVLTKERFRDLPRNTLMDLTIPPHQAHLYLDAEYKRLERAPLPSSLIGIERRE